MWAAGVVNKIIASVSDANVLDSIINSVPGIDIVIVPNLLYANDEGALSTRVGGLFVPTKALTFSG